jgi:hypothetical protein
MRVGEGGLPRIRGDRVALWSGSLLVLAPLLLYLSLLAVQAYSVHQASIALTQLENLRLGDPASSFDRAVSPFRVEAGTHVLNAGAYRWSWAWEKLWLFNQSWGDELFYWFNRAGLRWWNVRASSSSQNEKLTGISVGFMVVGRYEMLGTGWRLDPDHPSVWGLGPHTEVDRRTLVRWFHITSMPNGEGWEIVATPESTPAELAARHINRNCLLTLRGCDGLCELLPQAMTVLRERGTDWGGYTSVPASPCQNKD